MRITVLLLALFLIVVSLVGLVATDRAATMRRSYYATPARFYTAGAVRLAMGLILLAAASSVRWPVAIRVMGVLMCAQAVTGTLLGLERARAVMEWESMQGTGILRAGALVALASGIFLAFVFMKPVVRNSS